MNYTHLLGPLAANLLLSFPQLKSCNSDLRSVCVSLSCSVCTSLQFCVWHCPRNTRNLMMEQESEALQADNSYLYTTCTKELILLLLVSISCITILVCNP